MLAAVKKTVTSKVFIIVASVVLVLIVAAAIAIPILVSRARNKNTIVIDNDGAGKTVPVVVPEPTPVFWSRRNLIMVVFGAVAAVVLIAITLLILRKKGILFARTDRLF